MRTSPFPMPPIELKIKGAHEVASLYILAISLQTVIDTLIATYPEIVQQDDECSRYHMAETALLAERLVKRSEHTLDAITNYRRAATIHFGQWPPLG